MISVREALDRVLEDLPRVGGEQVPLAAARGRVLAAPIRAPRDVPPFRNSAMDGYAVRSADVTSASATAPVVLRVLETVGAGSVASQPVAAGTAIRIMTGAPLPGGADAVVRVEDTADAADGVAIHAAVGRGNNVREAGEDMRAGETVLEAGRLLRPADIGLLASLGLSMLRVARRPRVAILSTGDELVDLGEPLGPGQIVNSNAYTLAAAVEEAGAEPIHLGIVRDRPDLIRAAFADAMTADMALSTGGVSVGSFDYVRAILAELGYEERFWKVAQKPGKPLTFGRCGRTPVFGLPGNPVSSLVCFYLYVLPALRTMLGLDRVHLASAAATLVEGVRKAPGLTEFVRCSLQGSPEAYTARSTGTQSSGALRSLSLGDALIVGPADAVQLEAGARVRVVLLNAEAVAGPPF
ncbi:MAG TPA: gephyrin-like molybdotransferase Glp [Candidatus Dormibacteraeota bacterium]|nr:gephyrin-like molybdotransferase Glp [Candidatus Dormibacteraeota bacterium]